MTKRTVRNKYGSVQKRVASNFERDGTYNCHCTLTG